MKPAIASALLAASIPAFANLMQLPNAQVSSIGAGAASTLTAIQDNKLPAENKGKGCASVKSEGTLDDPGHDCQEGLEGGDRQAIDALLHAGEDQAGDTAGLTEIYVSQYNIVRPQQKNSSDTGLPLVLADAGYIVRRHYYVFILDVSQARLANKFCPDLSRCAIAGGLQSAPGATEAPPETMDVAPHARPATPVPEPLSLALFGAGLLGLRAVCAKRARA
jgi:hypothetical protein